VAEEKPYTISRHLVYEAYKRVRANRGAAGVDGESLAAFEKNLKGNLYKIWNRMSSGSYFPPAVRLVEIPKAKGGKRPLGIPTVADRVAQTVVKLVFEPEVEPLFHPDSYGYRPAKSALDAVGTARKRCWRLDWVIDLDIKAFFDSLDHELVQRAVERHTKSPWVRLYIARWLRAPMRMADGTQVERTKGTPQGGVISPLLANLFMHYAFDEWMRRHFPRVPFERYADDVIVHCMSETQARVVLATLRLRLQQCRLELHPTKTKIVYCKDKGRGGQFDCVQFDFLGYTFRPRKVKTRFGEYSTSFLPAISEQSAARIRATVREWRLAYTGHHKGLADLGNFADPYIRGWLNYYGRFYRSRCLEVLHCFNRALVRWVCRKYKRFGRRQRAATHWLGRLALREPNLFYLWHVGVRPAAG
jgi:group II intron reverse transcriptase/maturase